MEQTSRIKKQLKERRSLREKKRKAEIQIGDSVKIKTARFGKQYAKGRPEYTKGKVVAMKGKKAVVVYEGSEETYDTYKTQLEKEDSDEDKGKDNDVAMICHKGSGIENRRPSIPSWPR